MAFPVSAMWERHLRRGARPVGRVDVQFPGGGTVFEDLPVSGGSISFQRGSAVRASGSITVPVPELFPLMNDDSVIEPYGAEVVVYAGLLYPSGGQELIPLGVFPIESVSGSDANGHVSNISFYDRGKAVERSDYITPTNYGGVYVQHAIEEEMMYASPFPNDTSVRWMVNISPALNNYLLPRGTVLDKSRYQFVDELCEALGAEVYFDRFGNATVQPIPGIYGVLETPSPHWVIDAGENGVLIDASRSVSRDGTFNGVVVEGSADGDRSPPRAFVTDDHPLSRTRWGGPFGRVVKREQNSNLTSHSQCEVAAKAILKDSTGLQRSLSFNTYANCAMDPGDIILVRSLDAEDEIHMLDSYTYSFGDGSISADTRSIQWVD